MKALLAVMRRGRALTGSQLVLNVLCQLFFVAAVAGQAVITHLAGQGHRLQ